jgi:UDP-N-acetylmuramate--alanine ligase
VLQKEIDLRENFPRVHKKVNKIYFIEDVDYTWRTNLTRFKVKTFEVSSYEIEDLGHFETPLIGQIGIENSLAVISTLHALGFNKGKIKEGIATFKGVKRKLELVYNGDYRLINDHAHSPIKIESCLKAVRIKYPNSKIFVIFDVHQSGLKERRTFEQLKYVFGLANFVLIPRVTPDANSLDPIYGKDYKELIKEGALSGAFLKPENVLYTPLIQQLKSVVENNIGKGDVILIMSSGDVRELLDTTRNLKIQSSRLG